MQFWFIALALGVASGAAAVGFRLAVTQIETTLYAAPDAARLRSAAAALPWWWVVLVPVGGGLAVGLITQRFTPDGRVRNVGDVIEGAALYGGRVEGRAGLGSALASLVTLSTGGSTGREGPVVHLAAVISSKVCRWIRASEVTGRDLLGCAVAAAVSASFNAPIAGALFALEVVLRHFAVRAFAPIVIASVAGTVIGRSLFGDVTEFRLPPGGDQSFYAELPAYLILGLLCGLVAVAMMRAIFLAEGASAAAQRRAGLPPWARPALAGLLLGLIAIPFPHIIGVGYETTSDALTGAVGPGEAVLLCAVKVVAVAITLGGRMGGGVFSPSLMVGALTGLAFGLIATGIFPDASGAPTLYALAGMGAVAAAVLGAPISTTLIVFELTGDWQTAIAVMTSVSLASAVAGRLVHRSFFLTQLERRGVHLSAGPQAYLLSTLRVGKVMRARDAPNAAPEAACRKLIAAGLMAEEGATLEAAMPKFERAGRFLPVVERSDDGTPHLVGALFQVDALRAFNRALAATAAEEHS